MLPKGRSRNDVEYLGMSKRLDVPLSTGVLQLFRRFGVRVRNELLRYTSDGSQSTGSKVNVPVKGRHLKQYSYISSGSSIPRIDTVRIR